MTLIEIGVPALAAAIAGGMYLYVLNERRKLREARNHRHIHPAE